MDYYASDSQPPIYREDDPIPDVEKRMLWMVLSRPIADIQEQVPLGPWVEVPKPGSRRRHTHRRQRRDRG